MKKKIIIISIILVILFLLIKGFFLYYYNIDSVLINDYDKIIENFKFKNTVTIKTKLVENNNYLTYKNIKIRNDFKDFVKKVDENINDYERYMLYDENKNIKAVFMIGKNSTYTYILRNNPTYFIDDKRFSPDSVVKILDENNITNDIELFEFLKKNMNRKANIFTSIKKMREYCTIQYLAAIMLPTVESLSKIDGDYDGFIYNLKYGKEANILIGDDKYTFTFFKKDYFTDDYIKELLNTVVIDK